MKAIKGTVYYDTGDIHPVILHLDESNKLYFIEYDIHDDPRKNPSVGIYCLAENGIIKVKNDKGKTYWSLNP